MPHCDVCGEEAVGVASSQMGPISFAYCEQCAMDGLEPYDMLVGMVAMSGKLEEFHSWFVEMVKRSCVKAGKSDDDFSRDVEAFAEKVAKDPLVSRQEDGFTVTEVIIGIVMVFVLLFFIVAFIALAKYIGWI